MTGFLQLVVNGLTIGSVYALIAVGLSLVWATLRSLNFAHGDLYMLGAYSSVGVASLAAGATQAWHPLLVVVAVMAVAGAVGAVLSMVTERVVFRPLREAPPHAPILATIGVSMVLQNVIFVRYGATFQTYPAQIPRGPFTVLGIQMNLSQVLTVAATFAIVFGLHTFLSRARTGRAMRAISWDRETAKLMGVDTDRLILLAFAIGGALAGMGGAFVSYYYGVTTFFMGFLAVVKGFTAAVFGGFGNIRGALLGGLLLGVFEAFASGYIGGRWRDVVAFGLLMAIILFRPTGILGERLPARV